MDTNTIHLILADDDPDDCLLFQEALDELALQTTLTVVNDGEQLMHHLANITGSLPHVLFLDLNMPRKNGFDCLDEIKQDEKLKQLPVIIFSTSHDKHTVDWLYRCGAQYYIRKPSDFSELKKVIGHALTLIAQGATSAPSRDAFFLNTIKSAPTLK